jgi:predicted nucleotidyltransferase
VSPSAEEKQMREDVIARISKVVETLWPSVQLRVFGSCATDIYLPTSDIDLCIMGANACSPSPIDELASALRRRSMGRYNTICTRCASFRNWCTHVGMCGMCVGVPQSASHCYRACADHQVGRRRDRVFG